MVLPVSYMGLVADSIYTKQLDLSTKQGAMLVCCLGRLTTAAIGSIYLNIRRLQISGTDNVPADYIGATLGSAVAATSISVSTDTQSTGKIIVMGANPTALGSNANVLFMGQTGVYASTQSVTVANTFFEWARIGAAFNATASLGGTAIWLDSPLMRNTVNAELVTNLAEVVGPMFLEGGAVYEIIFNAAAGTAAGGPVAIAAYWEELTCETST
jgi:hypothetical protein